MSDCAAYIHGTNPSEQERLAKLGDLTDEAFYSICGVRPRRLRFGRGKRTREPGAKTRRANSSWPRLGRGAIGGTIVEGEAQSTEPSFSVGRRPRPAVRCRPVRRGVLPLPAGACRRSGWRFAGNVAGLEAGREGVCPGRITSWPMFSTPECRHFDRLWQRFAELQEMLGGDALIGKKLLPLLTESGFREIRLAIQPEIHHAGAPTFLPWVENYIVNIRSGERELLERGLATEEDIRQGVEDLQRLMNDNAGSAFFYWNRACAIK